LTLLLDTHIWLWSLLNPERIGRRTTREIEDPANELWISPISTWEVLTLTDKHRINIVGDVTEWITRARSNLREAPLTHEIAVAARQLRFPHQDPADRFLAATAQVLHLTLVTADVQLLGLGEISTLANR
jgi:PIN domain nuclease of toxin-antitoxin system